MGNHCHLLLDLILMCCLRSKTPPRNPIVYLPTFYSFNGLYRILTSSANFCCQTQHSTACFSQTLCEKLQTNGITGGQNLESLIAKVRPKLRNWFITHQRQTPRVECFGWNFVWSRQWIRQLFALHLEGVVLTLRSLWQSHPWLV